MNSKSDLVLCLGNEILSDDAVGFYIADELLSCGEQYSTTEILFAPLAGFALIDLLKNRERVLVVDSILTGLFPPGTLQFHAVDHFTPSRNLTCSHQINLPTAVELGRKLGCDMPKHIDVLTIELKDAWTLCEELTPEVNDAIPNAVRKIKLWINNNLKE